MWCPQRAIASAMLVERPGTTTMPNSMSHEYRATTCGKDQSKISSGTQTATRNNVSNPPASNVVEIVDRTVVTIKEFEASPSCPQGAPLWIYSTR